MSVPALEVMHLSYRFGSITALDGVHLRVEAGCFTALLGVNGAGKTTLLNLVTRLYTPRLGRIVVFGYDLSSMPRQALSRLGIVFQTRSLDNELTVRQNLVYQGRLHGMTGRRALARADVLLDRVGMTGFDSRKVATLSGGQARRVEIARALLHKPALLLCDEATVGLDVASRTDIVAHIHALAAEEGVGVLWATHLIDEIDADDSVAVLHKGRLLVQAAAADIAGDGTLSAAFLRLTGSAS